MTTTTWTGATNTLWGTGTNWDTGNVPTDSDDVVLTGSGTIDLASTTRHCAGLDATGFTGTLTGSPLNAHGNVTLTSSMTWDVAILNLFGPLTLTTGGVVLSEIDISGTITLGDILHCCAFVNGGSVIFGSRDIVIQAFNAVAPKWVQTVASGSNHSTWTTGKIRFTVAGQIATIVNSSTIPPVVISGAVNLSDILGDLDAYHFADLSQESGGSLDARGQVITLDSTGNLAFNAGSITNLGGCVITVGGNFSSAIDLIGASTWHLNVTGTATATGSTVTKCTAGGTTLLVSGGHDGGGNTNVTFVSAAPRPFGCIIG